jgi:hypothetical protein
MVVMNKNLDSQKESFLVERPSPDNKWITIFEDNGETGYMYLCKYKTNGESGEIGDHLWIYNQINPSIEECKDVFIIWTDDSSRTGLIIDGECWGIFDILNKRKLTAPRVDNCIVSIKRSVWDKGIENNEGKPLRLI